MAHSDLFEGKVFVCLPFARTILHLYWCGGLSLFVSIVSRIEHVARVLHEILYETEPPIALWHFPVTIKIYTPTFSERLAARELKYS